MTKFVEKINIIDKKIDNKLVHQQVKEVNKIISAVEKREVLAAAPQALGFLPDEEEDLSHHANIKDVKIMNHLLNSVRQFLSLKYGIWSLPNLTTAQLIKDCFDISSAVEIMAGNAYWSKALSEVGVKTIATDSLEWAKTSSTGQKPFFPVEDLNATAAIKKYTDADLILCSWSPNFGTSDMQVVKVWQQYNPQAHLLFVGEKDGATNSSEFWRKQHFKKSSELARINQSFVSYDFINEKIFEIDEL